MTFYSILETFADRIALTEQSGRHISYGQLAVQADTLAEQIGVAKQLLVIRCRNNIETIIGYLAALRGGHTVLLSDESIADDIFDKLISTYTINCIWEPDNTGKYKLNRVQKEPHFALHKDVALLLSTSGSIGSPKLVKLTGENLHANADSIVEYLQLSSSEKPITTLPLHYSYGLSVLNSHLLVGAEILLTSQAVVQREFWNFFRNANSTSFAGVPYTFEMLSRLHLERMNLPSLRYMTQAGGKLSAKLVRYFAKIAKQKNVQFYVMYGQTEATARISWLPPENVSDKPDSIGVAIPQGELYLENQEGDRITEPDIDGELIYKGANVMMGYAERNEDLAIKDLLHSVLHTGDIARFDNDGFFYITGRRKRFVKIHGNRVNLDEIEIELNTSGFVCKCTGKDNHLCIATLEDDHKNIIEYLAHNFRIHNSVVSAQRVDKFPMNASGKVQYNELFKTFS